MGETVPARSAAQAGGRVLDSLVRLLRILEGGGETVARSDLDGELEVLERTFEELRRVLDASESRELSDFLREVGDSVVTAQEQLDLRSKAYLESLRNQPHLQPATFRIPKVKGSIRCGMEVQTRTRVGLIFYSNTELAKTQHQQSIDFEIVAAPAPPEAVNLLRERRPRLELLLDDAARRRVFRALAMLTSAPDRDAAAFLLADPDRVLMAPAPAAPGSPERYLLAHGRETEGEEGSAAEGAVGIYRLEIASGAGKPVLAHIIRYTNRGRQFRPLGEAVARLAEQQVACLELVR